MTSIGKKLIPAMLIAGSFGLTSLAQAAVGGGAPGDDHSWHHDQPGPDGEHGPWHQGDRGHGPREHRLLDALGLSADQRAQIKAIHEKAHSQMEALESKSRADRDKMPGLSPKDPGFSSLVQEAKANAAARIQLRADLWTQTYAVLTPAQQAMIPVLVTAAKNERAAHEAAWKEHSEMMHGDHDHQGPPAQHP